MSQDPLDQALSNMAARRRAANTQKQEESPSFWERIGRLPGALATGVRIGSGVIASPGGAWGALMGAGGEGVAQTIENIGRLGEIPGAIHDISRNDPEESFEGFLEGAKTPAARMSVEGAIGAVPGGALTRGGKFLESGLRSGAMGGAGYVGRQIANDEPIDPITGLKVAGLSAVVGGTIGSMSAPRSTALPDADRLAKANAARTAAGQNPRIPGQPTPPPSNVHPPIKPGTAAEEKRLVRLVQEGLKSKQRNIEAEQTRQNQIGTVMAKQFEEEGRILAEDIKLAQIQAAQEAAGAVPQGPKFNERLTAKTDGTTHTMSTTYETAADRAAKIAKEEAKSKKALEGLARQQGRSPALRGIDDTPSPVAPVENLPASLQTAPEAIPPTPPSASAAPSQLADVLAPPSAPVEQPMEDLLRFFRGPAEASGDHYGKVKEAAQTEPKLREALPITDSRGRPYTSERIAGKNARQAAAAEGIPPLAQQKPVADPEIDRVAPEMLADATTPPTAGNWVDDGLKEVERIRIAEEQSKQQAIRGLQELLSGKPASPSPKVETPPIVPKGVADDIVELPPQPSVAPPPPPRLVKPPKAPKKVQSGVSDDVVIEEPKAPLPAREAGVKFQLGKAELENLQKKGFTSEQVVEMVNEGTKDGYARIKRILAEPFTNRENGVDDLSKFFAGKGSVHNPYKTIAELALRGGTGAIAGAIANDEDRLEGAISGGVSGLASNNPQTLIKNLVTREGTLETAKKIANEIPHIQRFNYLMSGHGLLANAVIGPYMSGVTSAIEAGLKGDKRGWAALKLLVSMTPFDEAGDAYKTASTLVETAERRALTEAPNSFQKAMSVPGTILTTGDVSIRNVLKKAGFGDEEAKVMTLTSEPSSRLGKAAVNFQRTGGPVANMMLPFVRTPMNILEQGAQRLPGVGALYGALTGKTAREIRAEQLLSIPTAIGAYTAGANLDPETGRTARRYVSNAGGRNALTSNMFYALGQASQQRNRNMPNALGRAVGDAIAVPQTDQIEDFAKWIGGTGDTPSAMYPKLWDELTGSSTNRLTDTPSNVPRDLSTIQLRRRGQ